jgi:hypothetical protein
MQLFKKFSSVIGHGAIAGFLALGMMSNASATVTGYAGVNFSSANLGTETTFSDASTIGWSFNLTSNRTLSSFGLYNTDLNASTTVSLWNSSGTLLASSVFDPSTYAGIDTSDLGSSGFLWISTSSLALTAGTYTIGAFTNAEHYAAVDATISSTSGLQIISKSLVSFDNVNAKPTEDFSSLYTNGLFGPNLRFAEAAPVPVPGSVWLLGSGLLGLFGLKRAKKSG